MDPFTVALATALMVVGALLMDAALDREDE